MKLKEKESKSFSRKANSGSTCHEIHKSSHGLAIRTIKMRLSCVIQALVVCCLFHSSSSDSVENGQAGTVVQQTQRNDSSSAVLNASQGESEIMVAASNASHAKTGLPFDENYETLLNGKASSDIDLLNDSAEVDDAIEEFKEFALPKEMTRTPAKKHQSFPFKNVYKVPKKVTKSVPRAASLRSGHTVNDFNPEAFSLKENSNQSYFHVFSNLYDHFMWSTSSLMSLSEPCLSDMSLYLNELKHSTDWAIRASDASGRYRGLFFFDNDYWLGSKQFCYEINYQKRTNDQPEMLFFVVEIVVKLLPSSVSAHYEPRWIVRRHRKKVRKESGHNVSLS